MKKQLAIAAAVLGMASAALAVYPSVPPADVALANERKAEMQRHSDEAWAKAMPIIKEWEPKGRPYLPLVNSAADYAKSDIPAFPGAEGPAAFSVGGRGGRVFVVNNLEDRGPGSFREALESGGPRIVVFNVAGIIKLKEKIVVRAPYLTIAGNTAPGDGVCIAGDSVELETHDVVIRHMRFRRGATWVGDRNDSLGGNPIGNILIDHVSASWGLDENMSLYRYMYQPPDGSKEQKRATVNVTIQWSISAEALHKFDHAFGSTIGGQNNAFHHNLFACNVSRNPSLSMGRSFNWINNVTFNWERRTVDGIGANGIVNVINNYYKPGPITSKTKAIGHRIVKVEGGATGPVGNYYVDGNIVDGDEAVTKDNWAGGVQVDMEDAAANPAIGQLAEHITWLRATEPRQKANVRIHAAREAYELVLANAGATLPRRDPVDRRVSEMVRTGIATAGPDKNGIIHEPSDVGGYPEYKGEPYADADKDGMPDEWEKKHGLNPNDASDAIKDLNGDGYTNIEKFIYGIDPAKKTDWKDPKNNFDPLMPLAATVKS